MVYHGNCEPLFVPPVNQVRSGTDVVVERSRVCPTAVRAYRFLSDDLATQSEMCSAVLQVPSVGIACVTPSVSAAAAAAAHPTTVLTVWPDTTAADVAAVLLQKVRLDVDNAFVTISETDQTGAIKKTLDVVGKSQGGRFWSSDDSTAVYLVKLFTGSVSVEGNATLGTVATVEFRQVVSGDSFVFPLRRSGTVDVEVPITTLSYRLGDPLFFTCTRLR
ncbi:uncharacterized protein TM35_000132920 [Trypanosoma theileri]|uniref:Uncharacterized protein n=1 Tax=Trypanosoma theileri TaxID=67003 RepID=A0A1X0NXL5_9TRYP|nr:uncharacterized protein TM35_000132920 [Trypanosoma theileri]ORC89288.1 hypothetical protein TM35_000132920 [Trypanosoma theileri]